MNTLQPNWPAPAHIKAYTTLKNIWDVNQPRPDETLTTLLHLPTPPLWIDQKHTAIAVEASAENINSIADASFTAKQNHVCIVLTADCLPLLICNQAGTHIAAIHAGWRGLAQGVIEATIHSLAQPASSLLVWLGPAIGPQKFEVGEEVLTAFTDNDAQTAQAFTQHSPHKWMANLYQLARIKLKALGVTHIYGGEYCTHTQSDLFFSYRRDGGKTGRMASLIWMADTP